MLLNYYHGRQPTHTFIFAGMHNDWNISALTWIIAATVCFGFPITSILFLYFRKDRRVLHDLLANTVVFTDSDF